MTNPGSNASRIDSDAGTVMAASDDETRVSVGGVDSQAMPTLTLHPDDTRVTLDLPRFRSRDEDDDTLAHGTSVGRYIVLDRIGAGGMGVVYAAYDPRLDRKIALKFVRPSSVADDDDEWELASARLQREAQALAQLAHANVVTVFDAGVFETRVFIAMEFLVGRTLKAWIREQSRNYHEILDAMIQAGRGLLAAHKRDLVHRDFKPDNVIVTDEGRVAVMDFGLVHVQAGELDPTGKVLITPATGLSMTSSASLDAPSSRSIVSGSTSRFGPELTAHGTIMGTVAYMSPEQQRGDGVDARSDQFSYCVALYELLYGVRPFAGKTIEALSQSIAAGQIREPKHRVGSRRVMEAIKRGLSPDPAARFGSLAELLAILEQERAPKRALWGTASALAVLAAVVGFATAKSTDESASSCHAADQAWDEAWTEQERGRLTEAFVGTSVSYAAESAGKVAAALDAYGAEWKTMAQDSCEATRRRGTQSEALMDLRSQCLDRRLGRVRALLGEFVKADPDTVQHALSAVYSLPRLDICANTTVLLERTPPPADEETAARVADLRKRIDAGVAALTSGHYPTANEQLDAVLADAREVDYAPVLAEALANRATARDMLGDAQTARRDLFEAVLIADAVGHEEVVESASSYLVYVDFELSDFEEADLWFVHSETLAERLQSSPEQRAWNQLNASAVSYGRLDFDRSKDQLWQAIELLEATSSTPTKDSATAYSNLGLVYMRLGEWTDALIHTRRAVDQRIALFGESHPETATSMLNLASVCLSVQDLPCAFANVNHAAAIWSAIDPEAYMTGLAELSRAEVLSATGEFVEAEQLARHAKFLLERNSSPDNYNVAPAIQTIAQTVFDQGRIEEAQALMEQVQAIEERTQADDEARQLAKRMDATSFHVARGEIEAAYTERVALLAEARNKWPDEDMRLIGLVSMTATSAYQLARYDEAVVLIEEALAKLGAKAHFPVYAHLYLTLALALDALDRPDEAEEALITAGELIDFAWASDELLGSYHFVLAKLEWPERPAAARIAADQAAAAFGRSIQQNTWIEGEFFRWFAGLPSPSPSPARSP